jgi:hypothetical protein
MKTVTRSKGRLASRVDKRIPPGTGVSFVQDGVRKVGRVLHYLPGVGVSAPSIVVRLLSGEKTVVKATYVKTEGAQ